MSTHCLSKLRPSAALLPKLPARTPPGKRQPRSALDPPAPRDRTPCAVVSAPDSRPFAVAVPAAKPPIKVHPCPSVVALPFPPPLRRSQTPLHSRPWRGDLGLRSAPRGADHKPTPLASPPRSPRAEVTPVGCPPTRPHRRDACATGLPLPPPCLLGAYPDRPVLRSLGGAGSRRVLVVKGRCRSRCAAALSAPSAQSADGLAVSLPGVYPERSERASPSPRLLDSAAPAAQPPNPRASASIGG